MTPPGHIGERGHGAQGKKVKLFRILKDQAGQTLSAWGPEALKDLWEGFRASRNSMEVNKNFHAFVEIFFWGGPSIRFSGAMTKND